MDRSNMEKIPHKKSKQVFLYVMYYIEGCVIGGILGFFCYALLIRGTLSVLNVVYRGLPPFYTIRYEIFMGIILGVLSGVVLAGRFTTYKKLTGWSVVILSIAGIAFTLITANLLIEDGGKRSFAAHGSIQLIWFGMLILYGTVLIRNTKYEKRTT